MYSAGFCGVNVNNVKTVGGVNSITLNESNLPSHFHTGSTSVANIDHSHQFNEVTIANYCNLDDAGEGMCHRKNADTGQISSRTPNYTESTSGLNHSHTFNTSSVGGNTAFSIVPQHYTVNFLLKL